MTLTTILWIIWGVILIIGSARNEKKNTHTPLKSTKNWLFTAGAIFMLMYAILWYVQDNSSIFFIFLEGFVLIACILMMLDTDDSFDVRFLGSLWLVLIATSLAISMSTDTLRFISGLIAIALGYTFKPCTLRRDAALTIGSILIVIFSFIGDNRIFFWINIFFAFFSAFYRMKHAIEKK